MRLSGRGGSQCHLGWGQAVESEQSHQLEQFAQVDSDGDVDGPGDVAHGARGPDVAAQELRDQFRLRISVLHATSGRRICNTQQSATSSRLMAKSSTQ